MEILGLNQWIPKPNAPLIIAGPCSAESEKQVKQSAERLVKNDRVQLMRAGVWKPRTRPNSFEGRGAQALKWLVEAQTATGLAAVIEVANADHVKAALDAGIRHLWIGARTTVNPFSVQEIAEALEGADIPVLVKNPMNPDLQLWMGALERLNAMGIRKLVGIHRGFNTYQDHVFRNSPNWEIPIELKTRLPELPIIVDPSHISGKRELLHEVAQKALDLAFDGLMIETHPNPEEALSDPEQQIPLDAFDAFLEQLQIRDEGFADAINIDRLERLRSLIDEIDYNLIENIKRRLDIVQEIGLYKAENNVAVFQLERWLRIFKDRQRYAEELNIDPNLIQELWKSIHNASIKQQTVIAKQAEKEKDTFET